MSLLREWAKKAQDKGFYGSLIRQILADENFEDHAVEGVIEAMNLREGTTSDFADLVGDSSNVERDLIKSYELAPSNWKKFVNTVPLRDMKTVTRLRRSDTDRYLMVPEGGEHEQGEFSTYKVTYTPQKFERGVNFTWEMLINDDLGAFRNIGRELGIAAQNTVNDFVISFIADNPEIYDTANLFDADHSNIGSGALAENTLAAGITAMREQTSEKGNPLNIEPGFLLVPPELEFTAKKLVNSALVPGGSLNDANILQGMVEVLVEPLLTDANNWYLIAKPSSIATVEVGFLGGREIPEILVKEDFDRDVIWYKGRMVFGGAVMDYRGFYGGIVG
ncbi:MAG: Mu-like prophage major head subunit gpT family protein [bacterium]|nr:Mu-like prophage major head subunit gpT family protein [bacterium]